MLSVRRPMMRLLLISLPATQSLWHGATRPNMRTAIRQGTRPSMQAVAVPSVKASFDGAFSWKQQWYPLAFAKVTDKTIPHRLEIFGEPLVLWWDHAAEVWATMTDACPHRLAPLSEGRIDEEGHIECPYHGWTFTSEGECAKIPQAAGGTASSSVLSKCRGKSFATIEKQGLIWAWAMPLDFSAASPAALPDETLIPTCDALDDERFVWIDVSRDMPYSADMLLENVLDSSHVPFTHHQTISKRENAVPLRLRLTAPVSAAGFAGEQAEAPPLPSAGVSSRAPQGSGAKTERTTVFRAPTYMHHQIRTAPAGSDDYEKGFETWTVAYATPTGPGRCRLLARFPFRFPPPKSKRGILGRVLPTINVPKAVFQRVPDWVQHMGQLTVLDDDNIFLPLQERRVHDMGGWRPNYVMPTGADTYVSAYRRWYDAAGPPLHAAHAVDHLQAAPLDKAALLDRFSQHTSHCKSCSGALKAAKRIVSTANVILILLATMLPWVVASSSRGVLTAAPALGTALATRSAMLAAATRMMVSMCPLLCISVMVAVVGVARHLGLTVAQRLTSGLPEYPPPRNRPAKGIGKGRELRTVEQGRRR